MYSDKKRLYFLTILVFSILFLSLFVPFSARRIVVAISLSILAALVWYLVKKRSILSINKGQVTLLMLIIGLFTIFLVLNMGFIKIYLH